MKGKIIVFEGAEGTGKTTIAKKVEKYLKNKGEKVVFLREPGGTEISEKIRKILLDCKSKNIDKKTELLLYLASRAQLISEKIKKLLNQNCIIILDRFYLATVVYQGYARGLNINLIRKINNFVIENIKPDIAFILDASIKTILKRVKKRKNLNRLDKEKITFHKKVRNGYISESKKNRNCFLINTDNKTVKEVFEDVLKILYDKRIIWALKI